MSGTSLPVLKGKRVTLRRPCEDDFQARLRLGTDAEIFRMYGGNLIDLRPMTEAAAKQWVQRLLDQDYAWIIEAGSLIGEIRLDRVDLRDRRASLAIGIEDASQLGKGSAVRLSRLLWAMHSMSSGSIASPFGWSTTTCEPSARIRSAGLSSREESARPPSSMVPGMTM
jgi:RimJ/RimL family protein N-acetyltransferase